MPVWGVGCYADCRPPSRRWDPDNNRHREVAPRIKGKLMTVCMAWILARPSPRRKGSALLSVIQFCYRLPENGPETTGILRPCRRPIGYVAASGTGRPLKSWCSAQLLCRLSEQQGEQGQVDELHAGVELMLLAFPQTPASTVLPKKNVLPGKHPKDIEFAIHRLSHRLRKCLGFKAPHDVFIKPLHLQHNAIALQA